MHNLQKWKMYMSPELTKKQHTNSIYNRNFLNAYVVQKHQIFDCPQFMKHPILILLYCKNKLCQRSRTQKHIICPVFPHRLMPLNHIYGSRVVFPVVMDLHWSIHTLSSSPSFDQSLWICKDNHSRLRVDSTGMKKRQRAINTPMLLLSQLWYILTLQTSIFLAPHPTNKKLEPALVNAILTLTKSLRIEWLPVVLHITDLHYKYSSIHEGQDRILNLSVTLMLTFHNTLFYYHSKYKHKWILIPS